MRYWPDRFELGAIAVDPSKGKEGRRGDYSAIVFAGVSGGKIHVDSNIKRRPIEQIISDGIDFAIEYGHLLHAFGLETNMFQELLVGEFERQIHDRGLEDGRSSKRRTRLVSNRRPGQLQNLHRRACINRVRIWPSSRRTTTRRIQKY